MKQALKVLTKNRREGYLGKWIKFMHVDYQVGSNKFDNWEYIERIAKPENGNGGIDIVGVVKYKQKSSKLVLIANFRPAVDNYVLEFPAGVVETKNETIDAFRELKEETGYTASKLIKIEDTSRFFSPLSPSLHVDPWKSNEASKVAVVEIDGDHEQNQVLKQNLDSTESIKVHLIDIGPNMLEDLIGLSSKHNYQIETKVYTYALGFSMASLFPADKTASSGQ